MKNYGIRVTLPEDSTMTMEHLLGKEFEAFRWYDTPNERDAAYDDMMSQPVYYRKGDTIQQILEKVNR